MEGGWWWRGTRVLRFVAEAKTRRRQRARLTVCETAVRTREEVPFTIGNNSQDHIYLPPTRR